MFQYVFIRFNAHRYSSVYKNTTSQYVSILFRMFQYVSVCFNTFSYVSICFPMLSNTLLYASIPTNIVILYIKYYVSVRFNTFPYATIRFHTYQYLQTITRHGMMRLKRKNNTRLLMWIVNVMSGYGALQHA